MAEPIKPLGPFEVGQSPLLIATVTNRVGGSGISTACTWTIKDPTGDIVTVSSPDSAIDNPSTNVWTYQMDPIEHDGVYWVKCQTTAGLLAAKTQRLGVVETPFETE